MEITTWLHPSPFKPPCSTKLPLPTMRQPLPITQQQSLITRRPSLIIRPLLTPQQHLPHTTKRQPLPTSQHQRSLNQHLTQRLHHTKLPLSTTLHQHLKLHPHLMLLHLYIMLLLLHTMLHQLHSRKQKSLPLLKS